MTAAQLTLVKSGSGGGGLKPLTIIGTGHV